MHLYSLCQTSTMGGGGRGAQRSPEQLFDGSRSPQAGHCPRESTWHETPAHPFSRRLFCLGDGSFRTGWLHTPDTSDVGAGQNTTPVSQQSRPSDESISQRPIMGTRTDAGMRRAQQVSDPRHTCTQRGSPTSGGGKGWAPEKFTFGGGVLGAPFPIPPPPKAWGPARATRFCSLNPRVYGSPAGMTQSDEAQQQTHYDDRKTCGPAPVVAVSVALYLILAWRPSGALMVQK